MRANNSTEVQAFKEAFQETVEGLSDIKHGDLKPVEERNIEVEALIDEYVETVGEVPAPYYSVIMSNYILADSLKDPTPYKKNKQEYPIHSDYDYKTIPSREHLSSSEILDFLYSKYSLRLDSLYRVSTENTEDV